MDEPKKTAPPKTPERGIPGSEPPGEKRSGREEQGPLESIGVSEFRRRTLALGFGILALGVLALLLAIYAQLAQPILWAVTLSILFFPLHTRIRRLTRGRRRLAAAIGTLLALAVVFIPAIFAVVHLLAEVRNLWPSVRDSLGPEAFERLASWIDRSNLRGLFQLLLGGESLGDAAALQARLAQLSFQVQDLLLDQMRHITRSVPAALLQLGVTILAFYFFLQHGLEWTEQIQAALPLEEAHARRLFAIAGQTINAVFRGVVLTALVQSILAGLGYWVAGAPAPILLSLVTLVAALIPFVGPVAIWLPTAVGLFLAGRTVAAIGLGLWGTLVVSLVDNTLRPYLIGREMKLPILWLFLSILGGLRLFGFLGVVVGPWSLALALATYRIYKEGRGPLSEDQGAATTTRRPS